jgi:hypothetical protein
VFVAEARRAWRFSKVYRDIERTTVLQYKSSQIKNRINPVNAVHPPVTTNCTSIYLRRKNVCVINSISSTVRNNVRQLCVQLPRAHLSRAQLAVPTEL